jgi:hypothetical protein
MLNIDPSPDDLELGEPTGAGTPDRGTMQAPQQPTAERSLAAAPVVIVVPSAGAAGQGGAGAAGSDLSGYYVDAPRRAEVSELYLAAEQARRDR